MRPRRDLLNALFADLAKVQARREKADTGADVVKHLRAYMRPYQRKVSADVSKRVCVRSARQQGKSTWALLHASIECLLTPYAEWIIIGLTRGSIRRIYWDVLRKMSEAFSIGLKFQDQAMIATFPNGSKIHFFGADKIDEIEKLRGGRYHGAIIDECKSYAPLTFKTLIEDIITPALKGQSGQLYLIGTPGDVLSGEFYLASCDDPVLLATKRWSNLPAGELERGGLKGVYSFHFWGPQTNDVLFADKRTGRKFTMWDAFQEEKADRGYPDDSPTWRREFLGQWCSGEGRYVYRYRPHANDYAATPGSRWGLPSLMQPSAADAILGPTDKWVTACGFDFGTRDGTAIVVWAWCDTRPRLGLYEVYSEKRRQDNDTRVSVSSIAKWYKDVEAEYGPFEGVVGDPAGLATMVIDTLALEHGVYVEPAEKKEKLDHIELFNNDLDATRIWIRQGSELSEELQSNKWLEKTLGTERRKEDPSTPNDLCDAALYGFRWCRHRQAKARAAEGPRPFTYEWERDLAAKQFQDALAEAVRKEQNIFEGDREWWN